ncbi:unnamed protein product [Rangifer tarandus platyrhynchus]|uniref:Uncharacterized protein n=1 Tax=Rangifer tarandus platyrhynchus TaxID=3082113 RepID=A0AC59Y3J0_RANTA
MLVADRCRVSVQGEDDAAQKVSVRMPVASCPGLGSPLCSLADLDSRTALPSLGVSSVGKTIPDPPHWWESVPSRACALGALSASSPAHPGPARGRARTPAPPPASACAQPRARLRERLPGACGRAGALAAGAQCERRSFSSLADGRI